MSANDQLTVTEPGQREGPYEETPEVTKQWEMFTRRMKKIAGPVDLEAEVADIRHPHPLRRKTESGALAVTDPNGVLVTFALCTPGYTDLRFFRDGRYSLNTNAMLYSVVCAALGRRLRPGEKANPADAKGKRVLVTIEIGTARDKPGRGGFFWNISGIKPIPHTGFADDDDDAPALTPAPAPATAPAPPPPAARAATPAEDDDDADFDPDDVPF